MLNLPRSDGNQPAVAPAPSDSTACNWRHAGAVALSSAGAA